MFFPSYPLIFPTNNPIVLCCLKTSQLLPLLVRYNTFTSMNIPLNPLKNMKSTKIPMKPLFTPTKSPIKVPFHNCPRAAATSPSARCRSSSPNAASAARAAAILASLSARSDARKAATASDPTAESRGFCWRKRLTQPPFERGETEGESPLRLGAGFFFGGR